jgi:hypothetical protein
MSSGWVKMSRSTPRRLASSNTIRVSLAWIWPLARAMPVFAQTSRISLVASLTVRSASRTGIGVAGRILLVEAGWTQPDVFSHLKCCSAVRVGSQTILPPMAAVCSTA